MIFLSFLFGCGAEKDTDTGENQVIETVDATIRVLSPMGGYLDGVGVSGLESDAETDVEGMATVSVEAGASFEIVASADGHQDHHFVGNAGSQNFELVSFMGDRSLNGQVNAQLGLTADDTKGTIVVALDRPDLSPALGAGASINVPSDQPYALGQMGASFTDTLGTGHLGALVFPNVQTGDVEVSVSHDSLSCVQSPAETETSVLNLKADTVSIIFFICD